MMESLITPKEAGTLYKVLCNHDARTLDPDCSDYRKLDLMLDDLRYMLMKIRDGKGHSIHTARKRTVTFKNGRRKPFWSSRCIPAAG